MTQVSSVKFTDAARFKDSALLMMQLILTLTLTFSQITISGQTTTRGGYGLKLV